MASLVSPRDVATAAAALEQVGIPEKLDARTDELSGGQQQRVAIARALVNEPAVLLADEPTGNLDSRTSVEVMALLQRLNRAGITIILVTHESDIAGYASRVLMFRDGHVLGDEPVAAPRDAARVLAALPEEALA